MTFMDKYQTQHEIIAKNALHHRLLVNPVWSRHLFDWPKCFCGGDISTFGDKESGIMWACTNKDCEYA